jgi:redox-sensitive bicupin YhaK (pirin superfamily)
LSNPAGVKAPFNVLLIAGSPLGEPVERYGPFVMNTKAELYQAFEDYRSGRMGVIE